MIEARKERVRELIRSIESVQVRSRALGEEKSAFEGRSSSLMETAAGKNDAAHFPREDKDVLHRSERNSLSVKTAVPESEAQTLAHALLMRRLLSRLG